VVRAARERSVPVRIGVNAGSLEDDIVEKHGWPTAEGMVESAERHIRFLEDEGYREIKSRSRRRRRHDRPGEPPLRRAVRLPAPPRDHRGGDAPGRTVKSAAGLGILLADGIGDTIRISLTADPVEEVRVARTADSRRSASKFGGATMTSCPTCGRCSVDMIPIASGWSGGSRTSRARWRWR